MTLIAVFSIHIGFALLLHATMQQGNEHLTVNIYYNAGNCIILYVSQL